MDYYTGHRISVAADIAWSHRVAIPPDLKVFDIPDPDDRTQVKVIAMDGGLSDVMSSFPPDWEANSIKIAEAGNIIIHVMDPVDLAVSKVARFEDRDQEDIRQLARRNLIDIAMFETRMAEALAIYVGDTAHIRRNIQNALEVIRTA